MFADEDLHRHALENLDQADALLFGRVTYEMMEAAWRTPARTGARPDWMEPFARTIDAANKFVPRFSWQSRASKLYSNSSTTISGFDPSRSGGPHVPAPLEVKTCIFPIRLKPYTNRR